MSLPSLDAKPELAKETDASSDSKAPLEAKTHGVNHPLAVLAENFLRRVRDMREAAIISLPAINDHISKEKTKCKQVLQPHITEEDDTGFKVSLPEDVRSAFEVSSALREFKGLNNTYIYRIVERSLFIGLFSEFDAFIGDLLKTIYARKPALFKDIKREISLTDLLQFESIEAIKLDMLEKEVDSFRRESYVEQFAMLEKKYSMALRKFPEWALFVEMGQRRNLMTHNDGVVSPQYLTMCDREGYKFKVRPEPGTRLSVGAEYYFKACKIISIVSFMLVYTLWKKILPEEPLQTNEALNISIYEMLIREQWATAARLGEFSLSDEMRKGADDLSIRIRVVNRAIGLKNCRQNEKVLEVLKSCDWSASVRDFKLAVAVLEDNYEVAAKLMIDIGKEGELVKQSAYHEWPLFRGFRERAEFLSAYEIIYDHPFKPNQEAESSIATIVDAPSDIGADSANTVVHAGDEKPAESSIPIRRARKPRLSAHKVN